MNIIESENRYTSGVYGKRDRAIIRGEGAIVWDAQGRQYIDCIAGIGVANLGHSHPVIADAISSQAQTLMACPELFYNDRRAEFIEKLAQKLPEGLDRIFLGNSGTEAVEGAVKFARLSTGRPKIIAAMRGFHGRTLGALSATHKPKYRDAFAPLVPGFVHVPFGNLDRLAAELDDQSAAVILEIVQGEGGVRVGEPAYFQEVRRLCHDQGVLLIVDEVQTGFGRTGHWFASEYANIVPDLICLGKGIANGVPMGAIGIGPQIARLTNGMHGSTFGGNPLACAAALATLSVFDADDVVQRAAESGAYLRAGLKSISSPLIREVRGLGLMNAVELKVRAAPYVQASMDMGVLTLTAGANILRLLPPLIISREQLDVVISVLAELLQGNDLGTASNDHTVKMSMSGR